MNMQNKLGSWMLLALVVGNMVGAGIYLIPSAMAGIGAISLYSWLFTITGILLLAFVFAQLNQILPSSGGPYVYCRTGFGDFIGFTAAYSYWLAWAFSLCGMTLTLVGYLGHLWPVVNDHSPHFNPYVSFIVKATVIWTVALINIRGIRVMGYVQIITTILKLIPLVLIPILALTHFNPTHFLTFNTSGESNISAFSAAAALALWAFVGFESATIPSEDSVNTKAIRRATIIGTLITAGLYLIGTIAIMGIIPFQQLHSSESPYADAAAVIFGHNLGGLISIGAIIAVLGAINGCMLLQVHVGMAAAQDRLFLPLFANKSRFDTPAKGFIFSAAVSTILLGFTWSRDLIQQFTTIVLFATFAFIVPYFVSVAAALFIFIKKGQPIPKIKLIMVLLAVAYAFWMIVSAGKNMVFYGVLLFFSAFPMYAWLQYCLKKSSNSNS